MTTITNTSQLATFSLIRTILRTNSTISARFGVENFYEFEPKPKSPSFKGFPFIVINVPDLDDLQEYLGDTQQHKEFEVDIQLFMDYMARDNYASYASNIITILNSSDATFRASGYNLVKATQSKPDPFTWHSKEVIQGSFTLILQGEVAV